MMQSQADYTCVPPLLTHERMYANYCLYNELIGFLENNGLGWTSGFSSTVGKRFVDGMSKALFQRGPPVWKPLNVKRNNGAASLFVYVCACINTICACGCGVSVDATIVVVLLLLLVDDIFVWVLLCWYIMSHTSRYCLRVILSEGGNCRHECGIIGKRHQPCQKVHRRPLGGHRPMDR